jgi:branched-subunit amino acid transport protein
MKRALMYIAPSALFALWIWIIVQGIDDMTAQEHNNHAIHIHWDSIGVL